MKSPMPFECKVPILYVNPPINADAGLVEEVSRAGGLGIVDQATAGRVHFTVSPGTPHGVRVRLSDLDSLAQESDVRLALIAFEDAEAVSSIEPGSFKANPVPVFVEVGSAKQGLAAQEAGAAGLIARGSEGPGWVSETCGFVLFQELLQAVTIPVFLQGGVGLRTAAGAMAAGAAGVVLDVHLLLTDESMVPGPLKGFLRGLGLPATVTLAEGLGSPLRVYSRVGTRMVRELRKQEESLTPENFTAYAEKLRAILAKPVGSPDSDEMLLPLSEDISTARGLAENHHSADEIVRAFGRQMSKRADFWPFSENSPLCREHGTRFPIVQGPMAHVSDNPDFLAAVANRGALPFLAMGNMPTKIAKETLALATEKTAGKFGVGLIGLEVNRPCYEAHLEIMKEAPPPFAILAAGSVDLAQQIEGMGIKCYLHCPAPSLLAEGLKAGHRRFVFEGCESGGHIGTLGSLDLWNANLEELESAQAAGVSLEEVTVLFAGGIGSPRASAFIGGMVSDLAENGLRVGLQLGTAYLATEEAVSTSAITPAYRKLTLDSCTTAVIGRTVNTRCRAATSHMAASLITKEHERLRTGVSLRERKELYERDNLGALRLASKGCAIDPETATWECPEFCELAPEEQLERGLYLMGQVVALLDNPLTIEELHENVIEDGFRVFASQKVLDHQQEDSLALPEFSGPVEVELPVEPIAIIGIGLRLPGSHSPSTFWEQIIAGVSGIGEVPPDRWGNPDFYFDPDPKAPDKSYTRIGGFVRDFTFDPLQYRIPPSVAAKMDRTQQLAITCVAEALADAGLTPETLKGKKVGIILGNSMGGENTDRYAQRVGLPKTLACLEDSLKDLKISTKVRETLLDSFRSRYLEDLPEITEDSLPGELSNVISGRVANVFNLEGPNFTVDAACASSMAAVMNAVAALRENKIDYALSGGVDASMQPSSFIKFCKIGALSPDGSRPFDEAANGFVMGEGAGIIVLKRLSDAVRDGDRIYGTIIGVGASSDGRGKGITAPNAVGQERSIRNCMEAYGIDPTSIGLVEAHGTSTPVGDKTELTVLDSILREAGVSGGSVAVGSVKSQIGHLKAAAGAAGMIKAILSLHHRTLPPTANVKQPNQCIDWESSPLFLITEPRPWERTNGNPRRAGVSAFGFGGTNFHIVLQEHVPGMRVAAELRPAPAQIQFVRPDWPRPPEMQVAGEAWVIGGDDEEGLRTKIEKILGDLTPANWTELAALHRAHAAEFQVRCGFAAQDATASAEKLTLLRETVADTAKRRLLKVRGIHVSENRTGLAGGGIAFLFPGQGSQYPFMLRDLAERFPVVARTLMEADEVLISLGLPSVTDGIFPASDTNPDAVGDTLKDTQRLQPMILTANTAIFRLLERVGVSPAAAAGHSLGEYAACVAAGVFSFKDAVEAVAVRGREMARVSIADPGLMMSIPADARIVEEVLAEVDGYVVAANKNSPKQTVISGETAAVKKAAELFKERGLEGILLPVSAAFHSGVVAPAREPFMKTLEKLRVNPPSLPVLSNVTGDFYPVGPAAPGRIRDLLGKQFAAPVEWVKSLRRLYSEGVRILLECGPKRVLTNLTLDTLPADVVALATNHPKKGGVMQLMETLAVLAVEGVPVDFTAAEAPKYVPDQPVQRKRPELKLVSRQLDPIPRVHEITAPESSHPLEGLLDEEVRAIASRKEFARFLELQGEPIRAHIKSGFQSFVINILPLDQTAIQVKSEGMDFTPVAVSGIAAGLPSDVRFPFDRENVDDLILGRNFIKKVRSATRQSMLEKNVVRLVKGPEGEVETRVVDDLSGVIQLAGYFSEDDAIEQYGLDTRLVAAMDVTTRLAVAAGIEALKDAGIPLVRLNRKTTAGGELPDSWALPPELRSETGVIFASAFPGMASLVEEVTSQTAARYGSGAKKRLIDFYTGIVQRIKDDSERESLTRWFADEFSQLNPAESEDLYTFNRDFLLKVIGVAHGQLAQLIKAQGPATHVDAACAGTTQAVLIARDWIRTGQAKRVIVIAADDAAGKSLFPWIGTGFLAVGAATTNSNVSEAALPFDDRRHGLIIGSAAAGLVVESAESVRQRGMEPIALIESGIIANSGYHGTRLDVEHISSVMQSMISKWEQRSGSTREELAKEAFFMSHETYSPKRGGSASAEIRALRDTFGEKARSIPIANTKGFTGHTMGAGIEDVVALRCLQKKMLPPIPNLKQVDPEFADLKLSSGGPCDATFALRLAAGFGSQVVMALYRAVSRSENRIVDLAAHRDWLRSITGYKEPVVSVQQRTLKVSERAGIHEAEAAAPAVDKSVKDLAAPAQITVPKAFGDEEVRERILALLAEKTGYPAEMLDTALDLEADLGIDTVKQAEFISEVRDAFDIPRIEGLKIADFPTIEHIINFVLQHVGRPSDQQTSATEKTAELVAQKRGDSGEDVRTKILALLSEKTGYPTDLLDPALDLEADLGIDTVKQAEFIAEIRETFGIPRIEGLKIADFPTINHIIEFVLDKRRSSAEEAQTKAPEAKAEKLPSFEEEVGVFEARLVNLPQLPKLTLPQAEEVLIAGGPVSMVKAVEKSLRDLGYPTVTRMTEPVLPAESRNKNVGIINLFGLDHDESAPHKTFELYLAAATTFDDGPAFLVTAVSEDGAYGFEKPTENGYQAGVIAGSTKSFGREYPKTRTRLLDLHPDLRPQRVSRFIGASLTDEFPLETAVGPKGELRAVRFVPQAEAANKTGLLNGDVVLVTGGARGITAHCVRKLAEGQHLTIVLLDLVSLSDRSEQLSKFTQAQWEEEKRKIVERVKRGGKAPTPVMVERELAGLKAQAEAYQNIQNLKAVGSEVIYRSVDVCDAQSVDQAILAVAETCGRVDVVVHGAGIDVSKALRSKTVEQMERVVAVKVQGMLNLLRSMDRHGMPPRRVIGFGSVAGRFGNLAQTDYSAANDGLAHLLRWADHRLDGKASIIDWSPWSEIGMATRGSVQQTLETAGIGFVNPRRGAEILAAEIARMDGSSEALAAGGLGPFEPDAFHVPAERSLTGADFAGQRVRMISFLPGEYLRATIALDPSLPLLDHHRIDKAAVLPGVGGMEIMRAAVALLSPDVPSVSFENVRFRSPLKIFKDEPFEAELELVRTQDSPCEAPVYRGRIFSWFVDKSGKKVGSARLHHEFTVKTNSNESASGAKFDPWNASVRVMDREIYSVFFHGPAFRFLDNVTVEARGAGVRFRYSDTPQRELMFRDAVPGAVEAAFQAAAAFEVESLGIMALPTGIGRLSIHSVDSMPFDGELVPRAQQEHEGPEGRAVLKFDGVIRDSDGQVIITLEDVEMVELETTDGFPGRVFEEAVPLAEIAREVKKRAGEFVKQTLDGDEAQEYASKKVPKRAQEWLSGRVALKRSVQRAVRAMEGKSVSLKSIRITPDEQGNPSAEILAKDGARLSEVSLSHSNGLALAAAAVPGVFHGIGVDLEKVEARSETWVQDYFTEEEIRAAGDKESRWVELTKRWCLKEAVLKAIGTGLRFDLRDLQVAELDQSGRATLRLHNEAAERIEPSLAERIDARVEQQENLVVARVLIRK